MRLLKPSIVIKVGAMAFAIAAIVVLAMTVMTWTILRTWEIVYFATFPFFNRYGLFGMVALVQAAIMGFALFGVIAFTFLSKRGDITGTTGKAVFVGSYAASFIFLLAGMSVMILGAAESIWLPIIGAILLIIAGVIPGARMLLLRFSRLSKSPGSRTEANDLGEYAKPAS